MIVVKLMGGMGNQMFQYALARSISIRLNKEIKFDLSFLEEKDRDEDFVLRDYDLDIFNVSGTILEDRSLLQNSVILRENGNCDFIPDLLNQCDVYADYNFYLEGYFQKHQYVDEIKDVLKNDFLLNYEMSDDAKKLAEKITSTNSVCINVRRADFVHNKKNAPFHGFYGVNYIDNCVPIILEKNNDPHFFIFSDDIEWCKNNIKLQFPMTFVSHEYKGKKFGQYMKLMSMCKDFIIPNSSFAWWAAWMNDKNPLVITPKMWFQAEHVNTDDLRPPSWVALNVPCEEG